VKFEVSLGKVSETHSQKQNTNKRAEECIAQVVEQLLSKVLRSNREREREREREKKEEEKRKERVGKEEEEKVNQIN
jgi:hypothetical protein